MRTVFFLVSLLACPALFADFSDLNPWNGISLVDKSKMALLALPGEASYTYPDGEKSWHRDGMSTEHDGSGNWYGQYGILFEGNLPLDSIDFLRRTVFLETMTTEVVPAELSLAIGKRKTCKVNVSVSPRVSPGGLVPWFRVVNC